MGLLKIFKHDCEIAFIHYSTCENEVTLHSLDLSENYLYTKINTESECIQRWAQNLQQTPEKYLSQLIGALEERTENDLPIGTDARHPDHSQEEESGVKSSVNENSFELDEGNNLVWKQCFKSKNISGRKGKFPLEERTRRRGLDILMNSLATELSDKEKRIQSVDRENRKLIKINEELRKISEESLMIKEKFEREIFGKFCSLLNAKKMMNSELRSQLAIASTSGASSSPLPSSSPRPSTSTVKEAEMGGGSPSNGDEFEADTDVDSPDEVEMVEDDGSNWFKRKGEWGVGDNAVSLKRSKPGRHEGSLLEVAASQEERNLSQDSPDLLDASLESDFKIGFGSHTPKKRH